jgi:hypothetical protein
MRTRLGGLCLAIGLATVLAKAALVAPKPAVVGVEDSSGAVWQDLYMPTFSRSPTHDPLTIAMAVGVHQDRELKVLVWPGASPTRP